MSATIRLSDGATLPTIGLGTHGVSPGSVRSAIRAGYRLIDTAPSYGNEQMVGQELRESGVPREEVRVITKVAGRAHGFRETVLGCKESLRNLGLSYVDLYLIHWPNPHLDRYVESWRAMIELRELGLVRSIGVSNFTERHLVRLLNETGVKPVVNQIELHPGWQQHLLRATHDALGITTMAWSPLGTLDDLELHESICELAAQRGWTLAQTVLRWHRSLGVVPIPRSSDPARQIDNLSAQHGVPGIDASAMAFIAQRQLWGADPETFLDE